MNWHLVLRGNIGNENEVQVEVGAEKSAASADTEATDCQKPQEVENP